MTIIKRLENSIILNNGVRDLLGINIGINNKGTAGTEFSNIRKDRGFILKDGEISEFNLPMITEIDNEVIIYSEEFNCGLSPLFNEQSDFDTIKEIIHFFNILKDRGEEIHSYATNLLYRSSEGDLLMMPPRIIQFINGKESLKKKLHDLTKFRHPDLKGERCLLFSIGILLYEHSTESYPIEYRDVEDLRDKMRREIFIKPRWAKPELSIEISDLIENLLDINRDITLKETLERISSINKEDLYNKDVSEEELNTLTTAKNRLLKSENYRYLLNKHRGLMIGIGIALIIFFSFFGTIISNALKPPATAGFNQLQVIEAYFSSFQERDVELLEDTVKKDVRKSDSNEIATLYVTERMRAQYEPNQRMHTPAEWLALSDDLKGLTEAYGIYNFEIEPIDPVNNLYAVSYEKWYTLNNEAADMTMTREIRKIIREEIFTMEETKYSWVISNIKTLMERDELVW